MVQVFLIKMNCFGSSSFLLRFQNEDLYNALEAQLINIFNLRMRNKDKDIETQKLTKLLDYIRKISKMF